MYLRIFPRFGRQTRAFINRMGHRGACSERSVPIMSPWRQQSFWPDTFWRSGPMWRDMEAHFDDMSRRMERMMSQCFRDTPRYYRRAGDSAEMASRTEVAKVKYDKDVFEVKLDVHQYKPDEMAVKMAGNRLTVTGKHEMAEDQHGFVRREFHREFIVPEDVDLDSLTSAISEEGILTVRANVRAPNVQEKTIEIQKETKETSSA